jgi:hypothetical protein
VDAKARFSEARGDGVMGVFMSWYILLVGCFSACIEQLRTPARCRANASSDGLAGAERKRRATARALILFRQESSQRSFSNVGASPKNTAFSAVLSGSRVDEAGKCSGAGTIRGTRSNHGIRSEIKPRSERIAKVKAAAVRRRLIRVRPANRARFAAGKLSSSWRGSSAPRPV